MSLFSARQPKSLQGFSLIELAIVLVIIGLLIGALFGGQSVIRSSQMKSIITDHTKYRAAVTEFKQKYKAIPGDMIDAQEYWGTNGSWSSGGTAGVINGNGDGFITPWPTSVAFSPDEKYQFWRQLSLAGMLKVLLTGISGPNAGHQIQIGVNVPQSPVERSGWEANSFSDTANSDGFGFLFNDIVHENVLIFGSDGPTVRGFLDFGTLTPEEALNIDKKTDDGRPTQGNTIATNWSSCTTASSANAATNLTANYNTANTEKICGLVFVRQF